MSTPTLAVRRYISDEDTARIRQAIADQVAPGDVPPWTDEDIDDIHAALDAIIAYIASSAETMALSMLDETPEALAGQVIQRELERWNKDESWATITHDLDEDNRDVFSVAVSLDGGPERVSIEHMTRRDDLLAIIRDSRADLD